jgi:hypothetical protein
MVEALVFESIKSQWWVLRIAEHELYSGMMKTDQQTIRAVTRQLEIDMRAKNCWPFDSPEELSLYFSG